MAEVRWERHWDVVKEKFEGLRMTMQTDHIGELLQGVHHPDAHKIVEDIDILILNLNQLKNLVVNKRGVKAIG